MRLYLRLRKQYNFSRTLIFGFPIYISQTMNGLNKYVKKSEILFSHGIVIFN